MEEKWASFIQTQTQEQKPNKNLQSLKNYSLLKSIDRKFGCRGCVSGIYARTPTYGSRGGREWNHLFFIKNTLP